MVRQQAALDLAPAGDDELQAALADVLLLLGGGMSQADRAAWIALTTDLVQELPGDLALEGVRESMKTCTSDRQIVPAIFAYARPGMERRKRYLENVDALIERARLPKD